MTTLSLKKVEAGMVLEKDVRDMNGRVLLTRGAVVEAKHLKVFKSWGVSEVDVCSQEEELDDSDGIEGVDPKLLEKVNKETEFLFRHNNLGHPLMRELFKECVKRELKKSQD